MPRFGFDPKALKGVSIRIPRRKQGDSPPDDSFTCNHYFINDDDGFDGIMSLVFRVFHDQYFCTFYFFIN
jgi:hypothetical protein